LDQNEKCGSTPKNPDTTKAPTKAPTAIKRGFFTIFLSLSQYILRCLSKSSPRRKKISARALRVLNQTYFPTINGKRVDEVTIATPRGMIYRKNLAILK